MKTEEEIIKGLKNEILLVEYEEASYEIPVMAHEETKDDITILMSKDYYEAFVRSLEKQMPKKPIAKKEEYEIVYDCPCCGRYFVSVIDGDLCGGQKYNYCCTCGQAIDWSDGE